MKCKSFVLSLVVFSALNTWAADDEMQTEIKGGESKNALPAESTGKLPPSQKPPSAADFKMRAMVRKKAPFWIDDKHHGAAIRINKDGTFSSEAQGGGSIAGQWKAAGSELQISTNDGGEKYSYSLKAGKKNDFTINGVSQKKGRFHIN